MGDVADLFPGASSGMAIMYRGLAGWTCDYVATSDISDIDLAGLAARSILIYDAPSGKFKVGYLSATDLADFDLTSLAVGCLLQWDGTNWVIVPPPTTDGDILMYAGGAINWASVYGFSWNIMADETPLESFAVNGGVALPGAETVVESFSIVVV